VRRENRASQVVLERCSDEEVGKQVVTVTTSRGSEKMELLLSTVVQACSPPPPGRATRHPVSRQYGSPPTPSGPVLHREPRSDLLGGRRVLARRGFKPLLCQIEACQAIFLSLAFARQSEAFFGQFAVFVGSGHGMRPSENGLVYMKFDAPVAC